MTIVIAAGGTGGHLFPAQVLAQQLEEHNPHLDICFAGTHLERSPFFQQKEYCYVEIPSSTPFRRGKVRSGWILLKGTIKSIRLLMKKKPTLMIGFGSFHSFPLLLAAYLLRIPYVLFEANVYPGKVNRLFSSKARWTGILFPDVAIYLKGNSRYVAKPVIQTLTEDPWQYFGLHPSKPVLLIFGGSQGAKSLNAHWLSALEDEDNRSLFQVIHLVGKEEWVQEIRDKYIQWNIPACVKAFEDKMALAYQIASIALCRSGASTIAELIAFRLPALLIPFPAASDDHQTKNAQFLQKKVGGAVYLSEKDIKHKELIAMLMHVHHQAESLKANLRRYDQHLEKSALWEQIIATLSELEGLG